jgi:hypothetical protein
MCARSGGTGRRAGLKIQWYLVPCGFDPLLRDHFRVSPKISLLYHASSPSFPRTCNPCCINTERRKFTSKTELLSHRGNACGCGGFDRTWNDPRRNYCHQWNDWGQHRRHYQRAADSDRFEHQPHVHGAAAPDVGFEPSNHFQHVLPDGKPGGSLLWQLHLSCSGKQSQCRHDLRWQGHLHRTSVRRRSLLRRSGRHQSDIERGDVLAVVANNKQRLEYSASAAKGNARSNDQRSADRL